MQQEGMLTARDIMNREVYTVGPETSVEEVGRLFIEKDLSGAPVVDDEGRLIGIVTENDLISQEKRFHIPTIIRIFDAFIPLESDAKVEAEIKKMTATTVSEISSGEVITVEEDTPLNDIATIMTEKKIHLLPVLKEGKIVRFIVNIDILCAISGM